MISNDYIVGLTKQVFMLDYIINGLFPSRSDIVRMIRNNKKEWKFNDKFEYRMLLAHTNSGGTLNSQVFKENVGLNRPGQLEYGVYRATYGTVSDGISVDMMQNLETANKVAAFEDDYSMRVQSLRYNVSSIFKNFAIHGQYGVVHQIRGSIPAPNMSSAYNPQPNVFNPILGQFFTIKVPVNVAASNFKAGRLLIKTTEVAPWGAADGAELYQVLDNQPGWLTLLPVGNAVSAWEDGQFLELQGNREIVGMPATFFGPQNWTAGAISITSGPYQGVYDRFDGTGDYTAGENAIVGAMEGLADMFPWYTDPATPETRLGLDMSYRDVPNRLAYSTEQAGSWVVQNVNEHIIDTIQRAAVLTKLNAPFADVGIWINPATKQRMGAEEGSELRVIRQVQINGPIQYQRGVNSTTYQIGQQEVKELIEDPNLPTDIIILGPKDQIEYNCWDNAYTQIDRFIEETWSKNLPVKPEHIQIPDEFTSSLDLGQRIIWGQPSMTDGNMASFNLGSRIRHPRNLMPVAYQEMGALFTEYPYAYTIVKLRDVETEFGGSV